MSNYINSEIRSIVAERANNICEYCLIAEEDSYYRHQIEHIISLKHGGSSELENLALACVFCNRNKGSDIASIIAGSKELVRFYNPRSDIWSEHFYIDGATLKHLTKIGEATVRILQMNHEDQILEREILSRRSRYPSEKARLLIRAH
ncbi:MAG TPA: HNH endonuclease signature motif containing protein [Pyrinomonadaceae bacterium]|jgi:hypothetical protein|nr:HNH endonuclease signature motif containing protein [Pyrinomonadaceae bacterium]